MPSSPLSDVRKRKLDPLGTKLVVKFRDLSYGKLGVGKRVVSVSRNLNLLENKATVNLSVADTSMFT